MSFWTALVGIIVASGVVFIAVSINGKDAETAGGHDDHGHGGHH